MSKSVDVRDYPLLELRCFPKPVRGKLHVCERGAPYDMFQKLVKCFFSRTNMGNTLLFVKTRRSFFRQKERSAKHTKGFWGSTAELKLDLLFLEGADVIEERRDLFLAELLAKGRHLTTTMRHRVDESLVLNAFLPF